jgi:hypothetical protein
MTALSARTAFRDRLLPAVVTSTRTADRDRRQDFRAGASAPTVVKRGSSRAIGNPGGRPDRVHQRYRAQMRAEARVEFKAVSIEAEASLDRRSTQLLDEIEVPFPKIRLLIDDKTEAGEAEMEKVKADLRRFCRLSKVVRNSGTEIEEVWTVSRP